MAISKINKYQQLNDFWNTSFKVILHKVSLSMHAPDCTQRDNYFPSCSIFNAHRKLLLLLFSTRYYYLPLYIKTASSSCGACSRVCSYIQVHTVHYPIKFYFIYICLKSSCSILLSWRGSFSGRSFSKRGKG